MVFLHTMHAPLVIHIILSSMTCLILGLAGVTALILALQDRFVRAQSIPTYHTWVWVQALIRRMPALITVEKLLFQIIIIGFLFLSLLGITSLYYFHDYFHGYSHEWLIKTIFTVFAWLIFGILLMGRYYGGWRGRKAIYGTTIGVLLLMVIYIFSNSLYD